MVPSPITEQLPHQPGYRIPSHQATHVGALEFSTLLSMPGGRMASSVNANAVLCVKGEIHNVLTVLRLNARWASRERFTREIPLQAESPLARAFKGLHSHLEEVDDLANVDTVR